jgi:hypothetical protein
MNDSDGVNLVRSCRIGILLAGLTLVGCGGGSSGGGSSNSDTTATTTTTTLTVATVKQCLRAGGATRVSGRPEPGGKPLPEAAEGNKGFVTARGPGGGRMEIGLLADPAEARELAQQDATAFPTATFESVGRAFVGLVKFAEEDRELALRCAGGL